MFEHAAATDVGRLRNHNEDSHLVVELPDGLLCAVSDGMGGHAAGEVASRLAIEHLAAAARELPAGEPALLRLQTAVQAAHAAIRAAATGGREGMGCTLTAAVWRDQAIELLSIGDSRAYRLRATSVEQLTEDDSLVGEMVRQKLLTADQARSHPARSYLTRALGVGTAAEYATATATLESGEVLLLCSDGLTAHVADDQILALVNGAATLAAAAAALVQAANEGGGSDNITVVLARARRD